MTTLALLLAAALFCPPPQAAAPAPPAFDAVSIKPAGANAFVGGAGGVRYSPVGLSAERISLRYLILEAYGLQNFQLSGGPDWLDQDKFSIIATSSGPTDTAHLRPMLQTALVDRFHLVVRRATQPAKVDLLEVDADGPKFKPLAPDQAPAPPNGPELTMTTLPALVDWLNTFAGSGLIDRPVVDQTHLAGSFDIHFPLQAGGGHANGVGLLDKDTDIGAILRAHLGLRLVPATAPVDVLVVVSATRPTPN